MEEIPSPISAQGELNAVYIALESDRLSERVDHIETGTARPRVAGEDTDASLFPRHPPPVTRHPFLFAGDDHIESGLAVGRQGSAEEGFGTQDGIRRRVKGQARPPLDSVEPLVGQHDRGPLNGGAEVAAASRPVRAAHLKDVR